jgi:hypothetical protein
MTCFHTPSVLNGESVYLGTECFEPAIILHRVNKWYTYFKNDHEAERRTYHYSIPTGRYMYTCTHVNVHVPDCLDFFWGILFGGRDWGRACFRVVHFFAATDEGTLIGDRGTPSREFEVSPFSTGEPWSRSPSLWRTAFIVDVRVSLSACSIVSCSFVKSTIPSNLDFRNKMVTRSPVLNSFFVKLSACETERPFN